MENTSVIVKDDNTELNVKLKEGFTIEATFPLADGAILMTMYKNVEET